MLHWTGRMKKISSRDKKVLIRREGKNIKVYLREQEEEWKHILWIKKPLSLFFSSFYVEHLSEIFIVFYKYIEI